MKNEFILAYPKTELFTHLLKAEVGPCTYGKATIYQPYGLSSLIKDNGFAVFLEIFQGLTGVAAFKRREEVEADRTLVHPISYLVFEREDGTVYLYQRGKLGGEGRLAGNESVGVGGHVETVDAHAQWVLPPYFRNAAFTEDLGLDLRTILASLFREAVEEVRVMIDNDTYAHLNDIEWPFDTSFVGALYDETNEVGLTHLGLVFKVRIPTGCIVNSQEDVIEDRGFFLPEKLLDENNKGQIVLENWSKVVLEHLVNEKSLEASNA